MQGLDDPWTNPDLSASELGGRLRNIDIIVQNVAHFTEKNKYSIPFNLKRGRSNSDMGAEEREQKC